MNPTPNRLVVVVSDCPKLGKLLVELIERNNVDNEVVRVSAICDSHPIPELEAEPDLVLVSTSDAETDTATTRSFRMRLKKRPVPVIVCPQEPHGPCELADIYRAGANSVVPLGKAKSSKADALLTVVTYWLLSNSSVPSA